MRHKSVMQSIFCITFGCGSVLTLIKYQYNLSGMSTQNPPLVSFQFQRNCFSLHVWFILYQCPDLVVVHTKLNIGPLIQHLLSQLAVLWWVFPHCYFQFSSVTVPHFFHFNLDLLKNANKQEGCTALCLFLFLGFDFSCYLHFL